MIVLKYSDNDDGDIVVKQLVHKEAIHSFITKAYLTNWMLIDMFFELYPTIIASNLGSISLSTMLNMDFTQMNANRLTLVTSSVSDLIAGFKPYSRDYHVLDSVVSKPGVMVYELIKVNSEIVHNGLNTVIRQTIIDDLLTTI